MGICFCISAIFAKGNNFCDFKFLYASLDAKLFQKGSTVKEKNLLLRDLFPMRANSLKC